MMGDEGAFRRRRSGKVKDIMHPLGESVALPRRKPPPLPENHGEMWEAINAIGSRLSNVEGRLAVLLVVTAGTFLGVLGLLLARAL